MASNDSILSRTPFAPASLVCWTAVKASQEIGLGQLAQIGGIVFSYSQCSNLAPGLQCTSLREGEFDYEVLGMY